MATMIETARSTAGSNTLACLEALEQKALWLACWTIHNANHLRPKRDGLKVGGHQASSSSVATLLTALYLDVLNPEDRVAVKPHAAPLFHALQYLLGNQTQDQLERFRGLGGAQSYPSRTKDHADVDFSTGSVGLGVGVTLFASLIQDYVRLHRMAEPKGRMIAVMGDAELDEGNIYEALLEGWKHDVRNLWWIVDYNRQSLDGVVNDALFDRIKGFFTSVDWQVVTLKYGKKLEAAFQGPMGEQLQRWIDACPNQLYSALTFKGGAAWRQQLKVDLYGADGLRAFLDGHDDDDLQALMTNLGGHDMATVLEAFRNVRDDRPHCFVAYTIKGWGLPLAGHKDNHAGLMTPDQMALLRDAHRVAEGKEWERFAGLDIGPDTLHSFLDAVPMKRRPQRSAPRIEVPAGAVPVPKGAEMSTQEAFGRIMNDLAKRDDALAAAIVTTSPDVTMSTNLGGWVNQRGLFHREDVPDLFRENKVASTLKWTKSSTGQHIELGIAENNLFLMLAAMGLSHEIFGARLLPVGTLYDPFIARGLDALNYACYQDARFILVATPSGITLAPEGGAHQSIGTPLIGMAQDGLASFEPAFADELATIMEWSFAYMQRDYRKTTPTGWQREEGGGSVYLRLSSRGLAQPERPLDTALRDAIIAGGYWVRPPAEGATLAIVYQGVIAPEALAAYEAIVEDLPGTGLLAVTSADRLNAGWNAAERQRETGNPAALCAVERLLAPLAPDATLVTVIDGHPATLAWMGAVRGQRVRALGVEHFGQTGDLLDLYRHYRIDTAAIIDACAADCLERLRG